MALLKLGFVVGLFVADSPRHAALTIAHKVDEDLGVWRIPPVASAVSLSSKPVWTSVPESKTFENVCSTG